MHEEAQDELLNFLNPLAHESLLSSFGSELQENRRKLVN